MRTRIVLGCAAVALAAAGCGKATAGHQNADDQHPASATQSTTQSAQPTRTSPVRSATAPPTHAAKPTPRATTAPPTRAGTPQPTNARRSPPAEPASGSRCHTSDLWAVFQPLGAAAGNQYGKILLTNHSGATCTVFGYGGISLTSSSGASVPSKQIRDTSTPPVQLTLRPGDHAYSQLHWSDVSGPGESSTRACEPSASGLQVIPPDETRALDAHWPGSPACEHGQIRQGAYRAGTGPASGG
ncbi:MAG TPA: DUF4232 domain-containing protein [Mycobacteriales bacterium]|jgi:hypothetical protein|nr:DUF4232 domain-containing protein [Mycobacteriales bacterium]